MYMMSMLWRDIRKVDDRLRVMEKKMWTIAGSIGVISVLVSPMGQRTIKGLTQTQSSVILETHNVTHLGSSRQQIHQFSIV